MEGLRNPAAPPPTRRFLHDRKALAERRLRVEQPAVVVDAMYADLVAVRAEPLNERNVDLIASNDEVPAGTEAERFLDVREVFDVPLPGTQFDVMGEERAGLGAVGPVIAERCRRNASAWIVAESMPNTGGATLAECDLRSARNKRLYTVERAKHMWARRPVLPSLL